MWQVLCVGWIYGTDRCVEDLQEMGIYLSKLTQMYWKVCWQFVTPSILSILLIFSWINLGHVQYQGYVYPLPVQLGGYFITMSTVIWIPVLGVIEWRKRSSDFKGLLKPSTAWQKQAQQNGQNMEQPSYGSCN